MTPSTRILATAADCDPVSWLARTPVAEQGCFFRDHLLSLVVGPVDGAGLDAGAAEDARVAGWHCHGWVSFRVGVSVVLQYGGNR